MGFREDAIKAAQAAAKRKKQAVEREMEEYTRTLIAQHGDRARGAVEKWAHSLGVSVADFDIKPTTSIIGVTFVKSPFVEVRWSVHEMEGYSFSAIYPPTAQDNGRFRVTIWEGYYCGRANTKAEIGDFLTGSNRGYRPPVPYDDDY